MGNTAGCPCISEDDVTDNGLNHTQSFTNYTSYNSLKLTMSNNEILYRSTSKSSELITKICIIQSDKIEQFFNSVELFLVPTKYLNLVEPTEEKDIRSSTTSRKEKPNIYYDNVRVTNYLHNSNYIMIYLQSNYKDKLLNVDKSPFKTVGINFGSNEANLIKEQLMNDLSSMLNKYYVLIGIISTGENNYQMIFKYNRRKHIQYCINVYESNYKSLEQNELIELLKNNNNKELICIARYTKEDKRGSSFFCIFEESNVNQIEYDKKIKAFIREQYPTELYMKTLSEESNKRGKIVTAIDGGDRTFILYK